MQVSTSYNATSLSIAGATSKTTLTAPATPAQEGAPVAVDRVELSAAALEAQSAALTMSGTTSTKQGGPVDFALGLKFDRATFAAASAEMETTPTGVSVGYRALAGELSSTSFSFGMASAAEDTAHLNAEVSKVSREIKPEVKEFLAAAGMKGGWGQVNRLLRSVA